MIITCRTGAGDAAISASKAVLTLALLMYTARSAEIALDPLRHSIRIGLGHLKLVDQDSLQPSSVKLYRLLHHSIQSLLQVSVTFAF